MIITMMTMMGIMTDNKDNDDMDCRSMFGQFAQFCMKPTTWTTPEYPAIFHTLDWLIHDILADQ